MNIKTILVAVLYSFFLSCNLFSQELPMVIVVPSYNNAERYTENLNSIFSQKYTNYRVIYIDDCSHDGTADLVESFIIQNGQHNRCKLIRNTIRCGALKNLYDAIHSCQDNEIIVTVDGDDCLYTPEVLSILNAAYSSQNIWLTHGTLFETYYKSTQWSIAIPENIIKQNAFRSYRCPSHLRTFYAWLFKKIKKEDLMYKGSFFTMAWDQAMMFPMIEMAGERHLFIKETLYLYNNTLPTNDNRINSKLQSDLEAIIRAMPPYKKLIEESKLYDYTF
jgi:glycosyltransferase involved in cell wall biosynthesis